MADEVKLLSIAQAAQQGIERIRMSHWADPMDHIKIDIIDGAPGPWLHLWCPFNRECNGRDPVDICWVAGGMKIDIHVPEFEAYTGALPDSEKYKAKVASFCGCLSDSPNDQ